MAASALLMLVAAAASAASVRQTAALMPPEWNLPSLPPAWGVGATGNHRCVAIPSTMKMCAGIGYTEMRLPNMLNHESAKEVQDQTEHWLPLVSTACHREIRVLLCSIYAPVCIKHLPEKSIKPCQTLCQAVKESCLAIMEKFGFAWPDMLNCSQFPPEHDLMCIKRSVSLTSVAAQSGDCQTCVREPTYESLVSSYCLNDIVLKTRIDRVSAVAATGAAAAATDAGSERRLQFKGRQRFFSSGRLQTAREKRQLTGGRVVCAGGCPALDEAAANPKRRYLIMGSVGQDGATLDVKLLTEWNSRQQAFRRAMRSIRRDARQKVRSLCSGGQRLLRIRTPKAPAVGGGGGRGGSGSSGGGRDGDRRRKKRRGRKRKRKGRRRQRKKAQAAGLEATTAAPEDGTRIGGWRGGS